VVRLVQEGTITGLRIDHVDGLLDPEDYLLRLRRATRVPYLAVEKVLHRDEVLPGSWPVQGSTGYALLNDLTDLTVDPQGWRELGAVTERLRGDPAPPFERIRLEARRQVLRELFGSEVQALVRRVARLASGAALDLEEGALREAVVELTAALEGYRTYVGPEGAGPEDRRRIERAVRAARGHLPRSARPALRFVHRVLTLELPPVATARTRSAWLEVVERWQQLSGPAAAKGVEDTALYREVRLICRNEVGADPGREPADLPGFHRRIRELHEGPHPLIATSTHDTKRSEDVRARIAVLSELPGEWERRAARWIRANRRHRRGVHGHDAPDRDEELLLYQTLLGAWPQDEDLGPFAERIRAYVVKAAREAKVHTSWLDPDAAHERTLEAFATAVIADQRFLRDFLPLQRTVAFHGALNSLSQVVLRTALPGVADLYNGTETWDLSLVDPDNRRPLDIRALARRLAELDRRQPREGADLASDLIGAWPDGLVKLFAVSRCLRLRRERPDVFVEGSYLPLQVHGPAAAHAVAIARRAGERWALAIVPRLTLRLAGPGRAPIGERIWAETVAMLPRGAPRTWVDAFTARSVGPDARGALALGQVLAPFPVALLVPAE
jgi:(1->4)-alpha-D-glucan 1-alpha-D-glucosylmutase